MSWRERSGSNFFVEHFRAWFQSLETFMFDYRRAHVASLVSGFTLLSCASVGRSHDCFYGG